MHKHFSKGILFLENAKNLLTEEKHTEILIYWSYPKSFASVVVMLE